MSLDLKHSAKKVLCSECGKSAKVPVQHRELVAAANQASDAQEVKADTIVCDDCWVTKHWHCSNCHAHIKDATTTHMISKLDEHGRYKRCTWCQTDHITLYPVAKGGYASP